MEMASEELNLTLEFLCQDFGGDWLLLGGGLICFDIDPRRGTHDIDLVRLDNDSLSESTRLITQLKARGISPEQLNSAVAFFLSQIPNWKEHIKILKRGSRGSLFRPTLTLFAALKLKRGTPVDLEDVRKAAAKWDLAEFSKKDFLGWVGPREVLLAKKIHLPV